MQTVHNQNAPSEIWTHGAGRSRELSRIRSSRCGSHHDGLLAASWRCTRISLSLELLDSGQNAFQATTHSGSRPALSLINPGLCCDPKECRPTVRRAVQRSKGRIIRGQWLQIYACYGVACCSTITPVSIDILDATSR